MTLATVFLLLAAVTWAFSLVMLIAERHWMCATYLAAACCWLLAALLVSK